MIARYEYGHIKWLDLETPTTDEARTLMEEFALDPAIAEELLAPSLRPRAESRPGYFYLVLHFPALRHTHTGGVAQEIDFIVGRDFIITTRYDTIDSLHSFSKVFEVNSLLDKSDIGEHAGNVFYYMLSKLYASLEHELEYQADRLEEVEERIFKGYEKEMVVELSNISRDLLNIKQATSLHRDVLTTLTAIAATQFGDEFRRQLERIRGQHARMQSLHRGAEDSLNELRQTNNSLLSTKQNEIMKMFTILAFVTFPLTLITSIFGMNTQTLPLAGDTPYDFWIITGFMAILSVVFFAYFKYKGWL